MFSEIIWRLLVRFLSPRPMIGKEGDILIIKSGWRTTLLTLGGRNRRITVDPKLKVLRVLDRRFWFFRSSRRLEFDWIAEILLDNHDLSPNSDWFSYYERELLMVGLRLKDGEIITLFRYYQEGAYVNNSWYPDWMRWEDFAAAAIVPGAQFDNEASKVGYVLSRLIGVPLN